MVPIYKRKTLPLSVLINDDNTHIIEYQGKRPKRTIDNAFKSQRFDKKRLMRYFRNEETNNDLPMFIPVMAREVNNSHPNHLEINARSVHNTLMRTLMKELNKNLTTYNIIKCQISNELCELKKICQQKKLPYDAFYCISSYIC